MNDYDLASFYKFKNDTAKQRGIEFDLSLSQFKRILRRISNWEQGSKNPHRVTLDRLDNSLGYVEGNVVVCSWIANNIKARFEGDNSSLTVDQFYKLGKKLKEML